MKRYLAALLVVLGVVGLVGVLAGGTGFAEDENAAGAKCSEATLDGTYLFAADGFDLKGNEQTPFATAGYEVYDGNGKVTGVQSGNFGGKVFRHGRFSGTYTVKADCTAIVTYNGGDPAVYDQFLAPDGSQFTFVQVKPSEVVQAGFEVRGTAKRVAQ
jgi:hypothetical protein